jgi:outer membrane protein assembly factor BamB
MRIPRTGTLPLAALVVCVLVALTGCTGPGLAQVSVSHSALRSPPGLQAHDPPATFAHHGIGLPSTAWAYPADRSVSLLDTTAFVASQTAVQAIDLRTGAVTATIRPAGPPGASASSKPPRSASRFGRNTVPGSAPVVGTLNGRTVILVAYLEARAARGPGASSLALEIDVIDPRSQRRVQAVRVPASGQPEGRGGRVASVQGAVQVVGISGRTVVITRRRAYATPITVAVGLGQKKKLWSTTRLTPAAVSGQILLAARAVPRTGKTRLVGVDVASGATRWRGDRTLTGPPPVGGAGPGLVLIAGTLYANQDSFLSLLDVATGKHRDILEPSGGTPAYTCRYDLAHTSVCTTPSGRQVLAVDAGSGKVLWGIGRHGHNRRVVPQVTAAYHGAVYATTPVGPVVLDARSGRRRNDHPGIAPVLVNSYAGIGLSGNATPTIHRVTP